jgi:hypothetical protein
MTEDSDALPGYRTWRFAALYVHRTASRNNAGSGGRWAADVSVGAMRKLIVQQWVTVDNIAAEEDGGLSFASEEPLFPVTQRQELSVFLRLVGAG